MMNVKAVFGLAFACIIPLSLGLLAQEGVDAGSFYRFGVGGRALAMAGTVVALGGDFTTTYWNPAGLAELSGIGMAGMYTNKFTQNIQFQFLSLGAAFDWGGLGMSMVRQAIEDIPFYGDGEGEFFSEYQTAWLATAAVDLTGQVEGLKFLAAGMNIKYYTHTLLEGNGQGVGFDLGILAKFDLDWGSLSFGLCAQDVLGTRVRWTGTEHEPVNYVPWINRIALGLGLLNDQLWLSGGGDFAPRRPGLNQMRVGSELWLVEAMALRVGLIVRADGSTQFTAGAGFRLGDIEVDYAFLPHPALGDSHIFSIEFRFAPNAPGEKTG